MFKKGDKIVWYTREEGGVYIVLDSDAKRTTFTYNNDVYTRNNKDLAYALCFKNYTRCLK